MPRRCTICQHADRHAIELALVRGVAASVLAVQYRLSEDALLRHRQAHLAAELLQEEVTATKAHALEVVAQLREINAASLAILQAARDDENPQLALRAIDRIHKQVELQAKLLGDLDERPTVTIALSPEWINLRTTILRALAPYPEARQAVADALMEAAG